MGIKATAAELTMSESAEEILTNPLWVVVPWLVLAVSASLKFWRLNSAWHGRNIGSERSTNRMRQSLIWAEDKKSAR